MTPQFVVQWLDRGRGPIRKDDVRLDAGCAPNPAFPQGRDLDVSEGADSACTLELPYPAQRCGVYIVQCNKCGLSIGVTTAGRPDDPRLIKVACRARLH